MLPMKRRHFLALAAAASTHAAFGVGTIVCVPDADPTDAEVIRKFPIRQPLLWVA